MTCGVRREATEATGKVQENKCKTENAGPYENTVYSTRSVGSDCWCGDRSSSCYLNINEESWLPLGTQERNEYCTYWQFEMCVNVIDLCSLCCTACETPWCTSAPPAWWIGVSVWPWRVTDLGALTPPAWASADTSSIVDTAGA